MHRKLAAPIALLAALALAAPAGAITNGVPDAGEHPYVGELLFFDPDAPSSFDDPGGWFSCSGTLVTPKVVVTAGHCTFGVGLDGESTTAGGGVGDGGNDIWINFGEAPDFTGFPATADFDTQQERYDARVAWIEARPAWRQGTAFSHPEFAGAPFFLHDVGVLVLDRKVSMARDGATPRVDYLDRYLSEPRNEHRFEVVGYGLERSGPFVAEGGDTRRKADVKLNTQKASPEGTFVLLSNNKGKPHTGGTCFGDSGGPVFDNTNSNLVVAVTSFGFSSTCTGVGGAYRLDQTDDVAFLAEHGVTP